MVHLTLYSSILAIATYSIVAHAKALPNGSPIYETTSPLAVRHPVEMKWELNPHHSKRSALVERSVDQGFVTGVLILTWTITQLYNAGWNGVRTNDNRLEAIITRPHAQPWRLSRDGPDANWNTASFVLLPVMEDRGGPRGSEYPYTDYPPEVTMDELVGHHVEGNMDDIELFTRLNRADGYPVGAPDPVAAERTFTTRIRYQINFR